MEERAVKNKVVILGGGAGGLSAAWMLARTNKFEVTLIEKGAVLGGVCGTFSYGGASLDYGPHKCYSIIPGIMDEFISLMGNEFLKIEKKNSIYMFGHYLGYPLRISELALRMGLVNMISSGLSMMAGMFKPGKGSGADSYENYVRKKFGNKMYSLVFDPIAKKTWGAPVTLSADIARARIPSAGFFDVAARLLGLKKENETTNARYFYYPSRGFGRIPERMAEEFRKCGGTIKLNTKPVSVAMQGNSVSSLTILKDGKNTELPCDILISAIPLHGLSALLKNGGPSEMREKLSASVSALEYRSAFIVYLAFNGQCLTKDHWIFFPESGTIFGRIFEQKYINNDMVPGNMTVIGCDFTDSPDGPLTKMSDEELAQKCSEHLVKTGIVKNNSHIWSVVKRLPYFYPRYDLRYKEKLSTLRRHLGQLDNLLVTGRVGSYNYNNADHCLDMGRFIADNLSAGKNIPDIGNELYERVASYRIVD